MNFVAKYVERVIVMAQGEIIKDGTPREIFSDYAVMEKAHIQPPQVFSLARSLASYGVQKDLLNPLEMAENLVQRGLI